MERAENRRAQRKFDAPMWTSIKGADTVEEKAMLMEKLKAKQRERRIDSRKRERVVVETAEQAHRSHEDEEFGRIQHERRLLKKLNLKYGTRAKSLAGFRGVSRRLRNVRRVSLVFDYNPKALLKKLDEEDFANAFEFGLRKFVNYLYACARGATPPSEVGRVLDSAWRAHQTSQAATKTKKQLRQNKKSLGVAKAELGLSKAITRPAEAWLLSTSQLPADDPWVVLIRSCMFRHKGENVLMRKFAKTVAINSAIPGITSRTQLSLKDIRRVLQHMSAQYTQVSGADGSRMAAARRILLLIAGVEPNPGPTSEAHIMPISVLRKTMQETGVIEKLTTQQDEDLDEAMAAESSGNPSPGIFENGHIVPGSSIAHLEPLRHLSVSEFARVCLNEESMIVAAAPGAPQGDAPARRKLNIRRSNASDQLPSPKASADAAGPSVPPVPDRSKKPPPSRGRRGDGKGGNRVVKSLDEVNTALREEMQMFQGRLDALNERVAEKQEELEESLSREQGLMVEVRDQASVIERATRLGYLPQSDGPARSWTFHGQYKDNFESTFLDVDPPVVVHMYPNGFVESTFCGTLFRFKITNAQMNVAATSVSTKDANLRYRNIYNGLVQSKETLDEVKKLPDQASRFDLIVSLDKIAFILTGTVHCAGRVRWMNDCEEWVAHKYKVDPPEDWNEKLRKYGIIISESSLAYQASHVRDSRAAPIIIEGLIPAVPDNADLGTVIAGIFKRLYPDLPERSREVLAELHRRAMELAVLIANRTLFNPDHMEYERQHPDLPIEHALKGRPKREVGPMLEGIAMFRDDPQAAIRHYLSKPYKCFDKKESYVDGSFKPTRFIMCVDLDMRGIQVAAMGWILYRIEVGTRVCNVKGLTADEITAKLKRKFENHPWVAETDFSSFESCIGPDLKVAVENAIFKALATDDATRFFIERCLDRTYVTLEGGVFRIPRFHHIRMSGDYWTSLGNLVENLVLLSYIMDEEVETIFNTWMIEGDDAVGPAPRPGVNVEERARLAGVKLTFDMAQWQSLSFCGNHFTEVDGQLLRYRDKHKACANLSMLFQAPRGTNKFNRMLQRSKALAYLYGPIIPDTFVYAALVERFTRDARVSEKVLVSMGLMKEWSGFSIERVVPEYLLQEDDEDFVEEVYHRNVAAGGTCDKDKIAESCKILRAAGPGASHVVIPSLIESAGTGGWYARDGSRFTHVSHEGVLPRVVWNDVQQQVSHRHGWFRRSELKLAPLDDGYSPLFKPQKEITSDAADHFTASFNLSHKQRRRLTYASLASLIMLVLTAAGYLFLWLCGPHLPPDSRVLVEYNHCRPQVPYELGGWQCPRSLYKPHVSYTRFDCDVSYTRVYQDAEDLPNSSPSGLMLNIFGPDMVDRLWNFIERFYDGDNETAQVSTHVMRDFAEEPPVIDDDIYLPDFLTPIVVGVLVGAGFIFLCCAIRFAKRALSHFCKAAGHIVLYLFFAAVAGVFSSMVLRIFLIFCAY